MADRAQPLAFDARIGREGNKGLCIVSVVGGFIMNK